MEAHWYGLDLSALPRGVVVADATADAAGLWLGPVASVLEDLAARLPHEQHPDVAFLGDGRTHPLAAVLRGLIPDAGAGPTVPVADQLGRYPVIGPLLWALSKGPSRPVVLVAGRPPVDLDDWAVPEFVRRLLVYRVLGDDRASPTAFRELDASADLGELAAHLADPVTRVRVGGGPALAVDWSNDAYVWKAGGLEAGDGADFALAARFVHPPGAAPTAVVTRAGGDLTIALVAAEPPPAPAAVALTPGEETVLGLWRNGVAYWCQGCRQNHPPGRVRCPAGADGPPLFPTLAALPAGTVCRLAVRGGWECRPVPRGVVALADGRVLVWVADRAAFHDPVDGGWAVAADDPGAFVPVDDEWVVRA